MYLKNTIKVQSYKILILGIIPLLSCQKIEIEKQLKVESDSVFAIYTSSAIIRAKIIDLGNNEIIQHGHCWSKTTKPDINSYKTQLGQINVIGNYDSYIKDLDDSTVYFVRPYIQNKFQIVYGKELIFKTTSSTLPEVEIKQPINIDTNFIELSAEITNIGLGIDSILNCGFYSTYSIGSQIVLDSIYLNLTDSKEFGFKHILDGLIPGTNYSIHAFAINRKGIGRSENIDVKTHSTLPKLYLEVEEASISYNSAICQIISKGGSSLDEKGICFSLKQNPTIFDEVVLLDIGKNDFELSGLKGNYTYFLRAYAKNDAGFVYSNQQEIITKDPIEPVLGFDVTDKGNLGIYIYIIDDGGATISEKGFCWSEEKEPTINDNFILININSTTYSFLDLFSPYQKMYLRPFVECEFGIIYGPAKEFIQLPSDYISCKEISGGSFQMGYKSEMLFDHYVHLINYKIGSFEVFNNIFCFYLNQVGIQSDGTLDGVKFINPIYEIFYEDNMFKVREGKEYFPVRGVSWAAAKGFCDWSGYRLPTEAEWEYSAIGGAELQYTLYSGSNDINQVAYYKSNSVDVSYLGTTDKKSNTLFIFSMSGNLREWCSDWYDPDYYSVSPIENPQGPETGTYKVVRGGSYLTGEEKCRVYTRDFASPDTCSADIGFRVVMPLN